MLICKSLNRFWDNERLFQVTVPTLENSNSNVSMTDSKLNIPFPFTSCRLAGLHKKLRITLHETFPREGAWHSLDMINGNPYLHLRYIFFFLFLYFMLGCLLEVLFICK